MARKLKLPVDDYQATIQDYYHTYRIWSVEAATGSGKSTRIPPMLVRDDPQVRILVCTATVESARLLRNRVQQENPDLDVQSAAGGINEYTHETRIAFATAGHAKILLAKTKTFAHFNMVMLDEIHTVSPEYEILRALIFAYWDNLKHVDFILSSACIPPSILSEWAKYAGLDALPCLQIDVPLFPIDEVYETEELLAKPHVNPEQLLTMAKNRILQYDKSLPPGHFLVFCPGEDIMSSMELLLADHPLLTHCWIYSAHSSMPSDEIEWAFCQAMPTEENKHERSIILSTDIAETAITIPGVVLVLDLGLQKMVSLIHPGSDASTLFVSFVSQFAAKQRRGRTGRTNPGVVHRMYTKWQHDNVFPTMYPCAIQRAPLHRPIIELMQFEVSPRTILHHFLHIPKLDIKLAIRSLCTWGLLEKSLPSVSTSEESKLKQKFKQQLEQESKSKYVLTPVAKEIIHLPLRLPLGRVWSRVCERLREPSDPERQVAAWMIAIAEVESDSGIVLCYIPRRRKTESQDDYNDRATQCRLKYVDFEQNSACPLNSAINAMMDFVSQEQYKLAAWCKQNGINVKVAIKVLGRLQILSPGDRCVLSNVETNTYFKNLVPDFQSVFTEIFTVDHRDRWWPAGETQNFYRLSRRSFGPTNGITKCLALTCNYVEEGVHTLKFLTTILPLEYSNVVLE